VDQKRVPVTREGLDRLIAELEELETTKMPIITAAVAEARSHGDLRENAGYEAARNDQMMAQRRIQELKLLIRNAELMEVGGKGPGGTVALGSTVVVDFEGDEERYTIVGAVEAKPAAGLISNESPIGKALIGRRAGQRAEFRTPAGVTTVKVIKVE